MQKLVPLSKLKPNPYRDISKYDILEEKVESLVQSYEQTGYWGNILARQVGALYEIAYGHHRLEALRRHRKRGSVPVLIQNLTNEEMIQIMASENLEEWGSSIWVEMETVKSTLEAYAAGDIRLPAMEAKVNKSLICEAPSVIRDAYISEYKHPYVRGQIASFLGWTAPHTQSGGIQLDNKCKIAFTCLEALERGIVSEKELRGLKRTDARMLCEKALSAFRKVETKSEKPPAQKAKDAVRAGKEVAKEMKKIAETSGSAQRAIRASTADNDVANRIIGKKKERQYPTMDDVVRDLCMGINKVLSDDAISAKLQSLQQSPDLVTDGQWEKISKSLASLSKRIQKWSERIEKHEQQV